VNLVESVFKQGNGHERKRYSEAQIFSENPYNPDSTSNEHGQHGSKYSNDSATNLYGEGLSIYGDDDG